MKAVRYFAIALLALTGIVHIIQLTKITTNSTGPVVITALFGLAYLVIAFFLYKENKRALWLGVTVPLIGLLLTLPGLFPAPSLLSSFFVLVDALVIASCAYLIYKSKQNKR